MNPLEIQRLDDLISAITEADLSQAEVSLGGAQITVKRERTGRIYLPDPDVERPLADEHPAIRAHMVGFFHPAEPPVSVGDAIELDTVVGSINALGLDNEIRAKVAGMVAETLVHPNQPVEFGQTLFVLERTKEAT